MILYEIVSELKIRICSGRRCQSCFGLQARWGILELQKNLVLSFYAFDTTFLNLFICFVVLFCAKFWFSFRSVCFLLVFHRVGCRIGSNRESELLVALCGREVEAGWSRGSGRSIDSLSLGFGGFSDLFYLLASYYRAWPLRWPNRGSSPEARGGLETADPVWYLFVL